MIGKAFAVKAFNRCQVSSLMKTQLIPLTDDGELVKMSDGKPDTERKATSTENNKEIEQETEKIGSQLKT